MKNRPRSIATRRMTTRDRRPVMRRDSSSPWRHAGVAPRAAMHRRPDAGVSPRAGRSGAGPGSGSPTTADAEEKRSTGSAGSQSGWSRQLLAIQPLDVVDEPIDAESGDDAGAAALAHGAPAMRIVQKF